jgi:outer membrane protein assembly factor BamB
MPTPTPAAPAASPNFVLARGLTSTAGLAALFCALVTGAMFSLHFQAATSDPWKSPQLLALKDRLVAEPKNETLKSQIRQLDFDFRKQFRRRLAMDRSGGLFLVAAALLAVVAAKKAANLKAPPPRPGTPGAAPDPRRTARRARWSVAITAGSVTLALAITSLAVNSGRPSLEADLAKSVAKNNLDDAGAAPTASPDEMRANWTGFRGWEGGGVTAITNAPLSWDGKTGRGVAWKSPVPSPGHSSPVVWRNQMFLTGATAEKREVFCYDVATGHLNWTREISHVPGSPPGPTEVGESTGFAASTGVTDGRRFYAIFANGDLAALNFDGAIAWSKSLGPIKNTYGHASSLALRQGLVIVQLDQGDSAKPRSKLVALDAATGRVRWEKSRGLPASWSSPIVIDAASKTQIIAFGEPAIVSYSLADGAELWRAALLQNEIVPSPIFADGLVIAASPSSKLIALRPDGAGDVTKTAVAWTASDNIPDITSPVASGGLVFAIDSGGDVTCFDTRDGKKLWEHELGSEVQASPVIMGNRLLTLQSGGIAVQLEVGRAYKELGRGELPDKFIASPAVAEGRIFLRGETNLFCLKAEPTAEKGAPTHAGN